MKDVIATTTFSCRVVATASLARRSSSLRMFRVRALLRLSGGPAGIGRFLADFPSLNRRPVRQVACLSVQAREASLVADRQSLLGHVEPGKTHRREERGASEPNKNGCVRLP